MLVDVHAIVGMLGEQTFTAEAVLAAATAAGITRTWVASIDAAERGSNQDEPDANLACLTICRGRADFLPVYALRPTAIDSNIHAIAGALDTEPFAAAAFWPVHSGMDADDSRIDRYLPLLVKLNCPLLVHTSRDDRCRPARIHALAKRARNLRVIVCPTDAASWVDALDVVARATKRDEASMWLTTSHATAEQVKQAVEQLGASRVLFGTDSPRGDNHADATVKFIAALRALFAKEAFDRVIGGNALELEKSRNAAR